MGQEEYYRTTCVIPRHVQWNHVRFWRGMSRSYGQIFHFGNVVIIPYLWLLWNVNTVCYLKRDAWYSLNCTIHGIEIHLFCYIINSQIIENKNCLLTWSITIIIPYDAIFSKNGWSVTFCLGPFQINSYV